MRSFISRLLSSFRFSLSKPNPAVFRAFEKGLAQQAIFQLEVPMGKQHCHYQYLNLKSYTQEQILLASSEPYFMVAASWMNTICRFKFLVQTDPFKPPLLHKFKGKITQVGKDKKTICVETPKDIIAVEQRNNLRIKPRQQHLPHLVVWGVHKNQDQATGITLRHHVILELRSSEDETYRTVKNFSAGGMRLSLPSGVFSRNKEWLDPGRKLIVQLMFSSSDLPKDSKHMFVAKISNMRTDGITRPELGIQFLASRVQEPQARWLPLQSNGCENLARIIHALQVQYYTEAKQRMAVREGSLSAPAPVEPSRPRRDA